RWQSHTRPARWLNDVVHRVTSALEEPLGSSVILSVRTDPHLYPVRAVSSEVEQIVTSLVLNARDAMPTGGTITLVTANVTLDEAHVRVHRSPRPGPCAMVSGRDTARGIVPGHRARVS